MCSYSSLKGTLTLTFQGQSHFKVIIIYESMYVIWALPLLFWLPCINCLKTPIFKMRMLENVYLAILFVQLLWKLLLQNMLCMEFSNHLEICNGCQQKELKWNYSLLKNVCLHKIYSTMVKNGFFLCSLIVSNLVEVEQFCFLGFLQLWLLFKDKANWISLPILVVSKQFFHNRLWPWMNLTLKGQGQVKVILSEKQGHINN